MSTTTLTPERVLDGTVDDHREHAPIPATRLVAVELRKMFDTRSGFWLLASVVITAVVATGAVVAFASPHSQTYETFAAAIGFPMSVILPVIAILSVTSEWSQRSGLTTFTLVPHRNRVVQAKAVSTVAVGVVSMVVAFAVGALGNVAGTAIAGTPQVWDVSLQHALLIVLGNVLGMSMGFTLGVLVRNSAGAVVAYFVYAFVLPPLSGLLAAGQPWFRHLQGWVDFQYSASLLFNGSLTSTDWAHVAVSGLVWLVTPLVVGVALVLRSEVA